MNDPLFIALQRLCPQHLLSRFAGLVANSKTPFIKNHLISWFIKRYGVDMRLAKEEDPLKYRCFNDFFTRGLKADVRPINNDNNVVCCPADGHVSQLGQINHERVFQAKGQSFSVHELLGGESEFSQAFIDGSFATIYLSPRDYHRVHMPLSGELMKTIHIPGDLFSVNTTTAENVPRLFARNERLVCHFKTAHGNMAIVLVGAMIVASIKTPWAGLVAPLTKRVTRISYGQSAPVIKLEKGAEVGRFLLGSTAIVLFEKNTVSWEEALGAGSATVMGGKLATLRQHP